MQKTIRAFAWLALFITAVAAVFTYRLYKDAMGGELGQKEDYAILQSVESEHRNDTDKVSLIIFKNVAGTGRDVVGFPVKSAQSPPVWVTLNKTAVDGTVFAMPGQLKNQISCRDIDTTSTEYNASSKIFDDLYSKCLK